MPLEHELPRMLREAGIATAEQADKLADSLVEMVARDVGGQHGATEDDARHLVER